MASHGQAVSWQPGFGEETKALLASLDVPEESKHALRDAASSILARGINPSSARACSETGLVVGYVQSGKTMSFEVVAALARDNGYQMVIIVAGTSIPLLEQSTHRLRRDLGIDDRIRHRRWVHVEISSAEHGTVSDIQNVLDDWTDPDTPERYRKTVLITVLKNHHRLRRLVTLLRQCNMTDVPVLIIDDEADQASLNIAVAEDEESTTYRRVIQLRETLPRHLFLQYTATPQAPLLVNIIDSLSPNYVEVLNPGEAYVGGQEVFGHDTAYVRVIPPNEVPRSSAPLPGPPDSLMNALRVFMIGTTASFIQTRGAGNRSMLVHPSHLTDKHREYLGWVRAIFEEWKRVLRLNARDPDRLELLEDFENAYGDLRRTVGPDLPEFGAVVRRLSHVFRDTRVLEVNARRGRTPRVDWGSAYGWILVGGQAMDRGFTVKELTVTYMPRGIGVGNADTVQQRARFLGYKRPYLGFCRVYLEDDTLYAFRRYVDHEEDIRSQLKELQRVNGRLDDWKRAFVLDPKLKPCRRQVLKYGYVRGGLADTWVAPRVPYGAASVSRDNDRVVQAFLRDRKLESAVGDWDGTDMQRHLRISDAGLADVLSVLLVPFRVADAMDSQRYTGMLLQLRHALEAHPGEVAVVYQMSAGQARRRGVDHRGRIANIFQGEDPGTGYPGDRAIRESEHVSVQIHNLDLVAGEKVVARGVAALAVWIPARLAEDWISQVQPAQRI